MSSSNAMNSELVYDTHDILQHSITPVLGIYSQEQQFTHISVPAQVSMLSLLLSMMGVEYQVLYNHYIMYTCKNQVNYKIRNQHHSFMSFKNRAYSQFSFKQSTVLRVYLLYNNGYWLFVFVFGVGLWGCCVCVGFGQKGMMLVSQSLVQKRKEMRQIG
ncbi:Hypothetical_protein [Hexamita inflata]|uniref:Hypothetical_protein n=1 Tax=Hexamita inflata TaxID=28002 RepID=A0AA86R2M1_9EUKA|nr:Hypothetical protein HINF_LOCUS58234 [Hexamita inflata]